VDGSATLVVVCNIGVTFTEEFIIKAGAIKTSGSAG
jgi:hypothetical protein